MIHLSQTKTKALVAIHGWGGAVLGLLLYAVIVTGTAAVFKREIDIWSAGALQIENPLHKPLDAILRQLAAETPDHYRDDVSVSATVTGDLSVFFHRHDKDANGNVVETGVAYRVAPDGEVISRKEGPREQIFADDVTSALGRFFVELHVRLHLPNPYGLILTGLLGLLMLMAAVSGLLMHRHLFTDLFTLRGRVRPVGMRDLHTVAATWTLPHAFVLAFTGAFFSFALSIGIPLLAYVAFSGDSAAMFEAVVGGKGTPDPRPAAGASFDQILSDARLRTHAPIRFVSIEPWGRADTRVTIIHEPAEGQISGATLVYAGETGSFISEKPALGARPSVGGTAFALMGPLHFGNFAGSWSKAIWFALGAASAYVTWSGLILWLRRRENHSGWRAFGRAVAWVGAGLPFAMAMSAAAFFVALPSGTTTWWTPAAFLLAAAAALVPALLLSTERIVPTLFSATGIALLSLPCLRLASGGPGWISALQSGQATIPTLDLLMITGALVCLFCSTASLRRETSNEATIVASQTPAE